MRTNEDELDDRDVWKRNGREVDKNPDEISLEPSRNEHMGLTDRKAGMQAGRHADRQAFYYGS